MQMKMTDEMFETFIIQLESMTKDEIVNMFKTLRKSGLMDPFMKKEQENKDDTRRV